MTDTLNHWAVPWAACMLRGLLDTALLLAVITLAWLALRRRASAQLGYWLFALVLFKLLLPVPVSVPAWLADLSPRRALDHVAERALPRSPAVPTVTDDDVAAPPTGDPMAGTGIAHTPLPDPSARVSAGTSLRSVPATQPAATAVLDRTEAGSVPPPVLSWRAVLMLVWAAVVAVLLARFLQVQWRTRRLFRAAVPLDPETFPVDLDELRRRAGLRRPVAVLGSDAVASPAVGGLLRPRLLVPLDLPDTLPPGQLTWVLLHELAHIRRGDLWLALLQRLLQIVYFFNPAVWLVNRQIDHQREYACDDTALALSLAPRRDCGAGFLSIVERVHAATAPTPLALGLFHDKTFLRRRLMRILDKNRPVRPRLSAGAALLLVAAAAVLLPSMHAEAPKKADAAAADRVKDDVPIQGRFLDLQGKPVAGVRVSVRMVRTFPAKEWDRFITFVKEGKPPYQFPGIQTVPTGKVPGVGPVATGRDGRFRLSGVGRDRVVELAFEGNGIESSWLQVMTHPGQTITSPPGTRYPMPPLYAPTFEHLVRPDRPIVGTVRDKQTGKPVAGIQVFGHGGAARAVTDERGRYELRGCPKSQSYGVTAYPAHGEPYFVQSVRVPDQAGLGPITADLEMVRGIPFRGRVIDRATGKGVAAQVNYYPLYPNPNVREAPGYGPGGGIGAHSEATSAKDGSFHCVVLPGPGFVAVRLNVEEARRYRSAAVDVKAFLEKGPHPVKLPFADSDTLFVAVDSNGVMAMAGMPQSQFQAIAPLNPAKGAKPVAQDLYLEPAPAVAGSIVGPDGRPVTGVRVRGLDADGNWSPALKTAEFRVRGLNPKRPRRLYFQHDDKHLVAAVEVRGDEKEPLTVHMERAAVVSGRLVNADGQPLAHAQVYSGGSKKPNDPTFGQLPENFQTDAQGRLHVATFIPGLKYSLIWADQKPNGKAGYIFEELSFRPGEVRDLGTIQAQPFKYFKDQ